MLFIRIFYNCALSVGIFYFGVIVTSELGLSSVQAQESVCSQVPVSEQASCREAYELLTRDAFGDAPAVLGVAEAGRWQYRYRLVVESEPGQPASCDLDGALVLPQQPEVNVAFTAQDDIYKWGVPALNAEVTGLPGRVEVIAINASQTGTFAGESHSNGADTGIEVRILERGEYETWVREVVSDCSN